MKCITAVYILYCVQYGNVGPMAITLCQSLGQNLGMMWNKDRATAGEALAHSAVKHTTHTPHSAVKYTLLTHL